MSQIDLPKIYNPATQTKQELIENFVVRTKIFQDIFKDIKSASMEHPEQHYIVQGVRGQGKTTLLLRIAYEIKNNKNLQKRLIPVIFNEEQYNVSRLFKLWETTAEYLEENSEIKGLYNKMQDLEMDDDYERHCFELLENTLKEHNKKAILFIDNIDEMLYKFTDKEHRRLREVFIESAEIRVIGASSVSLEFHHDYGKPFYQFFKMPQLRGLSTEETKTLLSKLGEHYKRDRVKDIIKNQPGRVEALRRITGGVIRTIIILFQIFVDDVDGNAFLDLEKVLDSVTPLYKHRMDKLSAQQQEIIDFIALKWDAVSTKEIAEKTKMASKAVSSQLKQLEKYHIIDKERTDTKNFLYRISERFFNIWYLMRLGRKWDERRVRFLVEFLQIWCDEKELEKRAKKHLESLRIGKLYYKHALFMTEALARTPLKREIQHQLIDETKTYLDNLHSELKEYVTVSDFELSKKAKKAFETKNFEDAIIHFEKIKRKEVTELNTLGVLYVGNKEIIKAETVFLEAVKKGDSDALFNLAFLYQSEFKDLNKAEEYYLKAVDNGNADAMYNLGNLYRTEFNDFKKAEKYYFKAADLGDVEAMHNLATLYRVDLKDFSKSEEYYLKAVSKGFVGSMNDLGNLYRVEFNNFERAIVYYLKAIDAGNIDAMFNLAILYQTEFKDFKKAREYYHKAVDKGHEGAMFNLAHLYQTEFRDFMRAEEYYLKAAEAGVTTATFNLGSLYRFEFKDYDKAEEYYLKAVDEGYEGAIFDLAYLYHTKLKKFERAEKYYLKAVDNGDAGAMNNLGKLYQLEFKDFNKAEEFYLKAVDEGLVVAISNLASLYENELKDTKRAESYYLKAIEQGDTEGLNSIAWMYFSKKLSKQKALKYGEDAYRLDQNIFTAHTYVMILLWDNQIEKTYKIAQYFLEKEESFEKFPEDITLFFLLLMAKKQYHLAFRIFNENPYKLKDRFKPVYYALMYFMQDEYPNEYRKMGSELKQTVEEIIKKIKQLEKDYK